jgi:hypothetical protein
MSDFNPGDDYIASLEAVMDVLNVDREVAAVIVARFARKGFLLCEVAFLERLEAKQK